MWPEHTVLDLFSGIGGFSLGLSRAGFQTIAFCEADRFCRRVLAQRFPGVPIHPDIRRLRATRLHPVLVCGGFPCQDTSLAGAGAGLDGGRSRLWLEMARVVGVCRPDWVVVENVPGLRGRGADRVIADLEARGYAVWPLVVGAVHAGAPHRRQRVFVVAHAPGAGLADRLGQPGGPPPRLPAERRGGWPAEPGLGRVVDGLPARLDRRARLTALGNAVVPEVATAIGQAIVAAQAAAERTRSAKDLRNFATLGATTARQ